MSMWDQATNMITQGITQYIGQGQTGDIDLHSLGISDAQIRRLVRMQGTVPDLQNLTREITEDGVIDFCDLPAVLGFIDGFDPSQLSGPLRAVLNSQLDTNGDGVVNERDLAPVVEAMQSSATGQAILQALPRTTDGQPDPTALARVYSEIMQVYLSPSVNGHLNLTPLEQPYRDALLDTLDADGDRQLTQRDIRAFIGTLTSNQIGGRRLAAIGTGCAEHVVPGLSYPPPPPLPPRTSTTPGYYKVSFYVDPECTQLSSELTDKIDETCTPANGAVLSSLRAAGLTEDDNVVNIGFTSALDNGHIGACYAGRTDECAYNMQMFESDPSIGGCQTVTLDQCSSFQNLYLRVSHTAPPSTPPGGGGGSNVAGPVVGTLFGVLAFGAAVFLGFRYYKKRGSEDRRRMLGAQNNVPFPPASQPSNYTAPMPTPLVSNGMGPGPLEMSNAVAASPLPATTSTHNTAALDRARAANSFNAVSPV